MIGMILNRAAKKVTGVNATLYLKVGPLNYTVKFGRGNPASPDTLEFTGLKGLMKGKPIKSSGNGHAIIAFKEMMGA